MEHTAPITLEEIFPQWEKLTPQQQELVRSQAQSKRFARGDIVHQGHNDCSGLLLVRDGQLRVFIVSSGGKEVTLYRLFSWDICLFTASCIMKNISFELHVQAERDSDVFIVPPKLYEHLMKESLAVADYTNQLMASRFSDVMWMMEQILFTSFDSRLSAFLLEQSEIEGSNDLTLTHEEIARHLGSAREVVSRMLKYFADDGLVQLSRGKVTLVEPKRLRSLVQ
ncbi:MAG: Crp/Fnr family transcriptional regulator [Clostridium sp.]|uniref:Crp/Fnr family transcriptional regulator n=1 Tax=Clostridium sp. TaxID=1506 RepID=UPI00290A3A7E|nr:Crp/Fnr family transcriptional regulator [Clostridium sp.]MDU7339098.1 Crp/Fnr family transcriptional regulator [Clostridium sp.]